MSKQTFQQYRVLCTENVKMKCFDIFTTYPPVLQSLFIRFDVTSLFA